MANTFSDVGAKLASTPREMPDGNAYGGRLRRYRHIVTLASQADGDTVTLGEIPAGSVFAFGVLTASATLGSSTIAIGTAASPGKYRAAAAHTATVPTMFGPSTAVDDAALSGNETLTLTNTTAALPSSGTLVVDMYFSQV